MTEMKPIRFGIVGCGAASVPVSEAMTTSPHTELTAVYDVDRALADDLHQRFRVPVAESLEGLLGDPGVDAVYVAVPHYLLASLTEQVLESGKHALTEKPVGISLEEIDHLLALADRKRLQLGTYYEMRYAPAHDIARELIQAGAIGEIISVQIQTLIDKVATYWQSGYMGRSTNPWRGIKSQAGGGVLLMNTSHLLDALFYVTGLSVRQVSAEIGTLAAKVEVEDTVSATLRFDNHAIGSLFAGAHIAGAKEAEHTSIYGTQGQIKLPDPYGSGPLQIYLKQPYNQLDSGQWHAIAMDPVPVHRRAVEEFAKALQYGYDAPIDAGAARRVLSVVLAIYQSAAEKRTITIP